MWRYVASSSNQVGEQFTIELSGFRKAGIYIYIYVYIYI